MIFLDDEYNRVSEELDLIHERTQKLEEDYRVKEYIKLKRDEKILLKEQKRLYKFMKYEEYEKCEHILVYTKISKDHRGRTQKACGCIKCGLDDRVLRNNPDELLYEQQVMFDYFKDKSPLGVKGKESGYACSLPLATALYRKINEAYPDINDKTALKYFEIALDNIRNIQVSRHRQVKRALRLSLPGTFDKWYGEDVIEKNN